MTAPSSDVRSGEGRRYSPVKPSGRVGYGALVLIAIAGAIGLAGVWADWHNYFLHERFVQDDPAVGPHELAAAGDLAAALSYALYAAYVLAGILLVVWHHQARRVVDSPRAEQRSTLRPLSWGCWLVAVPVGPIGALALIASATTTPAGLGAVTLMSTVGRMLMAAGRVLIIVCVRRIIRWQAQPRA